MWNLFSFFQFPVTACHLNSKKTLPWYFHLLNPVSQEGVKGRRMGVHFSCLQWSIFSYLWLRREFCNWECFSFLSAVLLSTAIAENSTQFWSLDWKGARRAARVGPMSGRGARNRLVTCKTCPLRFSLVLNFFFVFIVALNLSLSVFIVTLNLSLFVFTVTLNFLSEQRLCKNFLVSSSPACSFPVVLS